MRSAIAAATIVVMMPLVVVLLLAASPQGRAQVGYDTRLSDVPDALATRDIPPNYLVWYVDAARTCPGLPWPVLAGIGKIESDHGRSTAPGVHSGTNSAGAEGPMQFLPATFARYAVNADPSRPLTPYDPADAIFTAARMLCANGAQGGSTTGIEQALFAYNHAGWYVSSVMWWAAQYAAPPPPPSAAVAAAIAYARAQLGKPYCWGGAGPSCFDCSGLVFSAYAAAGIHLARTTFLLTQDGPQVPLSEIQSGDLLFSAGSDGTPANPGHVVMYLGGGRVIQSPQSGEDVQIDPLDLANVVVATRPADLVPGSSDSSPP
jgi:cell wall-associated NlpC family hydrolase